MQYETVDQATGEVKKKYVSLREHDPYKITLEEAIEVIRAKQEADANKLIKDYGVDNLRLLRGRWGPYLTDGEKNARLPKDREPETITLDEARVLIANAPLPKRRWGRPVTKKKVAKKAAKKQRRGAGGRVATARKVPQPAPKPQGRAQARQAAQEGRGKGAEGQACRRRQRGPGRRLGHGNGRATASTAVADPGFLAPRLRHAAAVLHAGGRHRLPHRGRLRAGLPSRRRAGGPVTCSS